MTEQTSPRQFERPAGRWQAISATRLVLERFDDVVMLYNRNTGESHILDAFPDELLMYLTASPRHFGEITAHMAELCDELEGEAWDEKINKTLNNLCSLRLVEYAAQ